MPSKILIAAPRGWCAGVDRAVEIVERALGRFGPPVYVRRQIVHNLHVVRGLEDRGAVFVKSEDEAPEGAVCVLSAHGVAPGVYENANRRGLKVIDATCPLVTKVHVEARRFARAGMKIVLIGHAGHEEIEGTSGEAPEATVVIERPEDVEGIEISPGERVGFLTQTTLAVDDTREVIEALRRRFPSIAGPTKDDICYASQNRQLATRAVAERADLVLVVGAENSSNSNRLVEVAREAGVRSYLIADETAIDPRWIEGAEVIGVSSGASTPEVLVDRVVQFFRARGVAEVEEVAVADEDVHFPLPAGLD